MGTHIDLDSLIREVNAHSNKMDRTFRNIKIGERLLMVGIYLALIATVWRGCKTGRFDAFTAFAIGVYATQLALSHAQGYHRRKLKECEDLIRRQQYAMDVIQRTNKVMDRKGNDWHNS